MAKVRLADLAKVAGVSAVTVHNAITGQKGVSDEMRARILEIAKEMGYRQPGSGARNTQGKSLRCIGVVIPERYLAEYTTFYWKMYQEMALAATEKSCMVTVEILKQEMEDEMIVPCIAKEQTVDALILMGDTSRDYIHYLKKNVDLPIIFLDFYDNEHPFLLKLQRCSRISYSAFPLYFFPSTCTSFKVPSSFIGMQPWYSRFPL